MANVENTWAEYYGDREFCLNATKMNFAPLFSQGSRCLSNLCLYWDTV